MGLRHLLPGLPNRRHPPLNERKLDRDSEMDRNRFTSPSVLWFGADLMHIGMELEPSDMVVERMSGSWSVRSLFRSSMLARLRLECLRLRRY